MNGLVQIQPDTDGLTGQAPGPRVAWFVEPDCLALSVGGESTAFAVGSAPRLPLLVKVFDFVPEGVGADLGDEKGAVVGVVQAGGGPARSEMVRFSNSGPCWPVETSGRDPPEAVSSLAFTPGQVGAEGQGDVCRVEVLDHVVSGGVH
ncbi:MAG: hypothetical protein M3Y48_01270, partial [Actinomycetota bacterium]|nr:hypothetical protein [Actinomycetota bacterium]